MSLVVRVENISPLLSFSHFKRSQRHGQCSLCASHHDHPLLLRKTILKEFLKDLSLAVVLTFLNLQTKRNFFLLYAIVTADLTDCCLPHHQQQLFKKLFFHARFWIAILFPWQIWINVEEKRREGGNLHLCLNGEDLTHRHSFPASSRTSLASFPLSTAQK